MERDARDRPRRKDENENDSKDFRVKEGDEVNLKKWPTAIDPVYKSKEHYHELLRDHVSQLSTQQQLLYAPTAMPSC